MIMLLSLISKERENDLMADILTKKTTNKKLMIMLLANMGVGMRCSLMLKMLKVWRTMIRVIVLVS